VWKIRRATLEDVPAVVRVFSASRLEALPYLPGLHTEDEIVEGFTRTVFEKNTVCVAEAAGGVIVGFIAFDREFVHHLYLLPDVQRQGLGSELLRTAMEGARRLRLWTFQKNVGAQRFYARHGFRILEATDGSANEEREPDVLMEWRRPARQPEG
jgi:putative acetyltransferase